MKKHAGPIIAAIVLVLPLLYIGSYLALVTPQGTFVADRTSPFSYDDLGDGYMRSYRVQSEWCPIIFWPLEQIDRKVRPESWYGELGRIEIEYLP